MTKHPKAGGSKGKAKKLMDHTGDRRCRRINQLVQAIGVN